ncbi:hydrogenase maturation protease [Aliiruegeria lutimaris]|uniref:Hydrogenase maturation protease n=1 Tax=Aliiruegeria lutimaris TaxID=571298 RepID=A0A1G8TNA5_9RHOB|nr:hydrogenase maturation protease [Aliiruegeria lutimaris]SDJ43076.1 hydrogenase maturation protease [Aliiruegeria lutimaris]
MAEGRLHVGIGNPLRRDDGVGPWVAQRLNQTGLRARIWQADGAGLIDLFDTEAALVLIDATRSGAPPGTLTRFDAMATPLPRPLFHNSTHEFGLAEVVEIARRLGRLPARLEVIGIEGADFTPGKGLSTTVRETARRLVSALREAT